MVRITPSFKARLLAKDEQAFAALYKHYVKLIYHIAYSYTYNKEDAEDITSQVFMKVINSIDTYEENGKFKEWISQITRNLALNFVTRNKHKNVILDEETVQFTTSDENNTTELITLFKEHLDEDTVSIMILRFIYNYKFKDIATYLGFTIGKVQGLYYDGIEKLRKEYKSE